MPATTMKADPSNPSKGAAQVVVEKNVVGRIF